MVLCYSASNETDISNVRFSSSLLTLLSIRSSGRSNHVRWLLVHLLFSRQQPDMRQVATRTIACGSHHTPAGTRTAAHRNPLPLVWCHFCKSRRVIRRVSTTILNPGRVFYKCPNHGVIICLSVVLLLSVADFLIVWLMIFQFDSCRKGKIRVICISGKLLMWGSETTLIIWLASESQYQQVGVLDK